MKWCKSLPVEQRARSLRLQTQPVRSGTKPARRPSEDHFSAFSRVDGHGKPAANLAERLHAFRVQTKRLNALLALLHPVLKKGVYRSSGRRIRRIRARFSAQRDSQVIEQVLIAATEKLSQKNRKQAQRWVKKTSHRRRRRPGAQEIAAAEREVEGVWREIVSKSATIRELSASDCEAGFKRLYRKSRKHVWRARKTRRIEELHSARRWIKQLKLALDACASTELEISAKILRRIGELEQRLGEYRDRSLAIDFCREGKRAPSVLRKELEKERKHLERTALKMAARMFTKPPGAFVRIALA